MRESENGAYEIRFMNLQNDLEIPFITEDPEIIDFKSYTNELSKASNKAYKFDKEKFTLKEKISSAEAFDGLNAMLVVWTLIEHFHSKIDSCEENKTTNASLALALTVHSYLNLTELGRESLRSVV
ncbi:TcdA/TcdB toxin, pore forming domain-containing protein [Xylaria nigripes]|nr:TcdA/TcdB toxin, pore forming domain-containing protein [Xylaria nigripes]